MCLFLCPCMCVFLSRCMDCVCVCVCALLYFLSHLGRITGPPTCRLKDTNELGENLVEERQRRNTIRFSYTFEIHRCGVADGEARRNSLLATVQASKLRHSRGSEAAYVTFLRACIALSTRLLRCFVRRRASERRLEGNLYICVCRGESVPVRVCVFSFFFLRGFYTCFKGQFLLISK